MQSKYRGFMIVLIFSTKVAILMGLVCQDLMPLSIKKGRGSSGQFYHLAFSPLASKLENVFEANQHVVNGLLWIIFKDCHYFIVYIFLISKHP